MLSHRHSVAALFAFFLTGSALWAHPGHGATAPETVTHYLIEPSHACWLLFSAVIASSGVLYSRFKKLKSSKVRVRK
ncbi:hypothetical protein OAF42_02675 [Planctomicrobium sp.]|jgi:hypothetical protein|nr:hypothetical protein [Planctomicrobium sp.]MBT5019962.1 hypothetical protein [Planctomicrobium sp.]MDB4733327.1 hypothetical protein [Planctomicrobium sp.]